MRAGLEALRQSGKLHKAKIVGYRGASKLIACCPFHHETRPSFAIFEGGGYHCLGCGVSGVVSRPDGGDDLLTHLSLDRPSIPLLSSKASAQPTALEPSLLDRAYRAALAVLTLRLPESSHLAARGLSKENLEIWNNRGYRSAPTSWPLRVAVADAVIAAVGKQTARSLPFLQPSQRTSGGLISANLPGLLIPIYDSQGRIVACKVRLLSQDKARLLFLIGLVI